MSFHENNQTDFKERTNYFQLLQIFFQIMSNFFRVFKLYFDKISKKLIELIHVGFQLLSSMCDCFSTIIEDCQT